ncbi:Golgi-specific brefeldin A-resistance guanine nucleotide exchange factor 1-like [Argonauta hians]
MGPPKYGIYIIQGEISLVVTAMRRTTRWTTHSHQDDDADPILNSFSQLKDVLNSVPDLADLEPNTFLSPFLGVIRSEDTTGPITGLALTSVNKFISYGLIEPSSKCAAAAIENIADAVTHARFVGTDPSSDEVVLMRILHVLRTLLLSPAGILLTNESVCEIMQSCFRICFEMRLSELLRKSAEHTLMDMVQLLFTRLPQFKEDPKWNASMKKLKMRTGSVEPSRMGKKKRSPKRKHDKTNSQHASMHSQTHSRQANGCTRTGATSSAPGVLGTVSAPSSPPAAAATTTTSTPTSSIPTTTPPPTTTTETTTTAATTTTTTNTNSTTTTPNMAMTEEGSVEGNTAVSDEEEEGILKDEECHSDMTSGQCISPGIIATTPAALPQEKTVIDINNSFQPDSEFEEASDKESYNTRYNMSDDKHTETEDYSSLEKEDSKDQEVYNPVSSSQERLNVSRPSNVHKCAETELNSEQSCPSEAGDDADSIPSVNEFTSPTTPTSPAVNSSDFVNPRGIRFMPQQHPKEGTSPLIPYGLPCVRELFRFLISLINHWDRHNTDVMIHMGLSLLTVALESGADSIRSFKSLLYLVKDEMCRNLFMLLQSERLSLFTATIRTCFLLFESMRSHLKFQLEMYLTKLSDIIVSEAPRIPYEMREISLEAVVHLWRIPGLVTELFLNYDCDLYCSNLFEDLTKLLSKNAFPVSGIFTTHLLSLDALLTVVDTIEQHCHSRILSSTKAAAAAVAAATAAAAAVSNGEISDTGQQPNEKSPESNATATTTTTGGVKAVPSPEGGDGLVTSEAGGEKGVAKDNSSADPVWAPKPAKETQKGPQIRPNRMKITEKVPTSEELAALKHKKKMYQSGSEQFNVKPVKGIHFLQEQGLLSTPLDTGEVVTFLKENPKLDKRQIAEYISNKKNAEIFTTFVKSFNFNDTRLDEALRLYLETFRLSGEAPVISYIIEMFAVHWHKTNGEPFANSDAAFTLAYAVIMLNVDQHNHNVKKQSTPMTIDEFKRNLSRTNGGNDFDEDMLEDIYNSIRNEEIVMPAEHTGLVKENYLWKVLLKRGSGKEGMFIHAPTGSFDHELFTLAWGPTVAALSFIFDKSSDEGIIQKAVSGFRKCAMISAHYGMSDVFDNLVISLCKFTTLLSSADAPENISVSFGANSKAQFAARTVFGLAHRHGDILREGWKNILDCLLQLYRAKLVPKSLIEVEDFADDKGKICIMKEETTATSRQETGMLSSFYGFFALSDSANTKGPTAEELEATELARNCIQECHLEQLIMDSKFLREEALQELVKTLLIGSQVPHSDEALCIQGDEDSAVFFLELLIKVVLQNRDRVTIIWQSVRDHLYNLIVDATTHTFLVERAVVGLLRIAIRLLRREEIASQVLASLRILLVMKPAVIHSICQQVAYGLHDLLRTNAANIHSTHDWYTLFTVLEVVGAGAKPPNLMQLCNSGSTNDANTDIGAQSDSEVPNVDAPCDSGERGYTSDSELYDTQSKHHRTSHTQLEVKPVPDNGSWLMVEKEVVSNSGSTNSLSSAIHRPPHNQYSIDLNEDIFYCDSKALLRSSETLAFLVRDAVHVTPHNFESCIHAIRAFVEASINGGQQKSSCSKNSQNPRDKKPHMKSNRPKKEQYKTKRSYSNASQHSQVQTSDEENDNETLSAGLHSLSIQLLDLMHTLHTRAASIFSYWAEEGNGEVSESTIDAATSSLWAKCWCPLLQGIARLCCDSRRQVRSQALTYLQRALLVHDLQTLSASEWEACFNKVLFPLLTKLLSNINSQDPSGMEETRVRASTLLCKVFLQHLSPLLSLSTFTALWLTILDFMDKYMHKGSDLLSEAIPESLKNMLLVMDTAGIFHTDSSTNSQLWKLTWDRIDTFLPDLQLELFKTQEPVCVPEARTMDRGSSSNLEKVVVTAANEDIPAEVPTAIPVPSKPHDSPNSHNSDVQTPSPDSGIGQSPRPESPLVGGSPATSMTSAYILQPPLPKVASPNMIDPAAATMTATASTVPLLLNPDIMQGTTIPFISPQMERHESQ